MLVTTMPSYDEEKLADTDDDYRRRVIEYPEAVLEEAEVVAHAETIEILRRRLDK